jgi:hypothetical protein
MLNVETSVRKRRTRRSFFKKKKNGGKGGAFTSQINDQVVCEWSSFYLSIYKILN